MNAIDTPNVTTGKAHDLQKAGIQAVGVYLRPDRCTKEMVDGLHSVGIKVFSVYEKGHPTSGEYFTEEQGHHDGEAAAQFAHSIGQPHQSEIFSAVDYDAPSGDLAGIVSYQRAFRRHVMHYGFLASVYASGRVCKALVGAGIAHSGWLSGSTAWSGFEDFKSFASVVQTKMDKKLLGLDVDYDTVLRPEVCW